MDSSEVLEDLPYSFDGGVYLAGDRELGQLVALPVDIGGNLVMVVTIPIARQLDSRVGFRESTRASISAGRGRA